MLAWWRTWARREGADGPGLSRLVPPLERRERVARGRGASLIVPERAQHIEEALRGFVGRFIAGVVRALVQPIDDLMHLELLPRVGRDPLLKHTVREGVALLRRAGVIHAAYLC